MNGQPIRAFVDSGAQSSIMSAACAERCNLLRLLDRRFAGMAVGVGTGTIVGQIHQARAPCLREPGGLSGSRRGSADCLAAGGAARLARAWSSVSPLCMCGARAPLPATFSRACAARGNVRKACQARAPSHHKGPVACVAKCGAVGIHYDAGDKGAWRPRAPASALTPCAARQATIKVGAVHLPMSITVLESGAMEFLLGLDMLRRYQCAIDLRAGVLRFGTEPPVELPFLAEHELPASARPGAAAGAPDEGAARRARACRCARAGRGGAPALRPRAHRVQAVRDRRSPPQHARRRAR